MGFDLITAAEVYMIGWAMLFMTMGFAAGLKYMYKLFRTTSEELVKEEETEAKTES